MAYHLDFTDKAKEDIAAHQKAGNKAALNKLLKLLDELAEHPFYRHGQARSLKARSDRLLVTQNQQRKPLNL